MDALRALDPFSNPVLATAQRAAVGNGDTNAPQADEKARGDEKRTEATVAVRRNADSARVEDTLNRQLAATQAANLARVVPAADAAPQVDASVSAVATAPQPAARDTQAERDREASNAEQRRVERQADSQRAVEAERAQTRRNAEARDAQSNAADRASALAVTRYQANQSLLEDAPPSPRLAALA